MTLVVAMVAGGALLRPADQALPPADKSPTPTPTPSAAPLPDGFARILASLPQGKPLAQELVIGDEIVAPNGDRTPIGQPDGYTIGAVSRVVGSWVIEASQEQEGRHSLLFRPEDGAPRQLVERLAGSYAISPDGKRIALAGDGVQGDSVSLRELPSGTVLKRTSYQAGFGPIALAIVGDQVVLEGAQGEGGAHDLAFWDLRTNRVERYGKSALGIVDLTPDGSTVVSRLPGAGETQCAIFGSLADLMPPDGHRFCGVSDVRAWDATLSPSGHQVAVGRGDPVPGQPLAFADVAEVRAQKKFVGRLAGLPKEWRLEARTLLWESEQALIVEMPVPSQDSTQVVLLRCPSDGDRCERVPVPGPAVGFNAVVRRYGS